MPEVRAYALRESHEETFAGGSLALGHDGETFDLAEELEKGGGVIETSDPRLIRGLGELEQFKQVSHAAAEAAAPDADPIGGEDGEGHTDPEKHTKDELIALADEEGADYDESQTKAEIAQAIDAAKADAEDGDE